MNNYISAKAAATKWDVSNTWITILCSQGRIPGAEKRNGKWMIPADISKLEDGRKRVFLPTLNSDLSICLRELVDFIKP